MKIFTSLIIAASLALLAPSLSHAQSGLNLGIFPPVLEITADPPATIDSKLVIQNLGESTRNLQIELKPFRLSGTRDGQIEFLAEGQLNGPDPLILQKVRIFDGDNEIKNIELAPFEAKELAIEIDLEEGAPLGDYYFSIVFVSEQTNNSEVSSSTTSGGIGTNVILGVGQRGKTSGQIKEFGAPVLNTSGPIPITLLLRNDSNHYIVPEGMVTIRNMFGNEVARLPILPQYILAGSERYLRDQNQASSSAEMSEITQNFNTTHPVIIWPEKFLFGSYTAEVNIKLSDNGPIFTTETRFYAIPLYIVFAVSFFAFVLIGIYIRVKRKI